ncbi:MAG: DUF262 domain-containing protein [Candidatus Delongbacteria bacterium]|nr:DUF262 domain-containing protein [Candidatus Delongbacteria bacterium]MBN2836401.1 DUF262 domain-containing protein [Candidatus Delongbacteria bacterium]
MKYKDPKPDIQRIEEIVTGVIVGDIRLPKFQRPFVWKRKEVIKLLDSIYNGYPIGSILLWQSSEQLVSERNIAELIINVETDFYPTNYLLDGQQRVSSLCGTLFWDGKNSRSLWNVAFDLEKERFIYPKDEFKIEYFPLNKLLNTSDFISQCSAFEAHPKKEKFYKNAEKLLRSIKDYKIAVVKIGEMTINEVAPIFERINSTGRKLTIVDLMRAATWKGDFDLNDALEQIKRECQKRNYFEISDNHILRNISACAGLGINRENIDRLRSETSENLKLASEKCTSGYINAIEFLHNEIFLPTAAYLPYSLQLTFLVEFFNLQPRPSEGQILKLKQWFWKTSISRHFGTSNTGQNARDLELIRNFALLKIDEIPIEKEISIDRFVNDDFRLNLANSKTFALLLANRKPIDLIEGIIYESNTLLSSVDKNQFHYIIDKESNSKNSRSCVNILFSSRTETKELNFLQIVSDIKKAHSNNFLSILKSHFIDEKCIEHLENSDYDSFFNQRKQLIAEEIIDLTGTTKIRGEIDYDPYSTDNESDDSFE